MDAQEPVGEDPALQVMPKLSLDEPRDRPAPIAGPGQERLEVLRHNAVENRLVGAAGSVRARGDASVVFGGVMGPAGEAFLVDSARQSWVFDSGLPATPPKT
jgi:hypothetical protein